MIELDFVFIGRGNYLDFNFTTQSKGALKMPTDHIWFSQRYTIRVV